MDSTKKKIAVAVGNSNKANLETILKNLTEQKVLDHVQVTFFPGDADGIQQIFANVKDYEAVIAMPYEGLDIVELWQKKWSLDDAVQLHVNGEFKYMVLVDEKSNDVNFLPPSDRIVQKIKILSDGLKRYFRLPLPRIAVMSTSKQSDAQLTKEDKDILLPAVNKSFEDLLPVFGPFSKEIFFASENFLRFDAMVFPTQEQTNSITHYFDGFNLLFELNVPFVLATSLSQTDQTEALFRELLFTVSDMLRNKIEYDEISKNPLKFELKRENNEFQAF